MNLSKNGLEPCRIRSLSCSCPTCIRVDSQAAAILQTGDRAHTLLGDATPVAAPVVEFIVGPEPQEWSSPAGLHPAAAHIQLDPASVRCERELERLRLLELPWMPVVVVDDDSVADVVAIATPVATAESSSSSASSSSAPSSSAPAVSEDLPDVAGNLHDMD